MSAPQNRGPFPTLRTCNPFLPSCCQKGFGHLNAKLFSSLLLSNPLEAVPTHTHCQTALVFHRGIAPTRCLTDLPAPVPREHCYQSPVSRMELLLGHPQTALSVLQLSSSSSDHPVCSLLSCSGRDRHRVPGEGAAAAPALLPSEDSPCRWLHCSLSA